MLEKKVSWRQEAGRQPPFLSTWWQMGAIRRAILRQAGSSAPVPCSTAGSCRAPSTAAPRRPIGAACSPSSRRPPFACSADPLPLAARGIASPEDDVLLCCGCLLVWKASAPTGKLQGQLPWTPRTPLSAGLSNKGILSRCEKTCVWIRVMRNDLQRDVCAVAVDQQGGAGCR